jgi:hypothetical protein
MGESSAFTQFRAANSGRNTTVMNGSRSGSTSREFFRCFGSGDFVVSRGYPYRMWRFVLLWVFVTSVTAQQSAPGDDGKGLLAEVRKKVMLTLDRLPKYMCTETIDRSTFQPKKKVEKRQFRPLGLDPKEPTPVRLVSCDEIAALKKKADWQVRKDTSDRLRLNVAVSENSEMFSWAGENRFNDRGLADLVRRGATSTGAFGSFLASIFGADFETNAVNFTYKGEANVDGRALVAFDFRVPLEKSTFRMENQTHLSAIVAYEGSFLVDPKTFDLVRLTIRASRISPEFNVCENVTTLDYGSVRLHDSEFLLPKDALLHVTNADGSELENNTVFSGCHEFLAESSVSFGTDSENAPGAAQTTVSKTLALPAGLSFRLALTNAIDTGTAAAGDPIKARLLGPIKGKGSGVLVPKGAAVTGRIVQIKRRYQPGFASLTLALKLETVEASGVPQPFYARPEPAVVRRTDRAAVNREGRAFGQMSDPDDPGVGFLEFQDVSEHFFVNAGVEIGGTTMAK